MQERFFVQSLVLPYAVLELVPELIASRMGLEETEGAGETPRFFFEKEVNAILDATEVAFFSAEQEEAAYEELRTSAWEVEKSLLIATKGVQLEDLEYCIAESRWRLYRTICDKAREIALVPKETLSYPVFD